MLTENNCILEHSKAKVELYSEYLSAYLNILSRVQDVKKIHIYDLFCGEGIYADGTKGSPVKTIDIAKLVISSLNNASCPSFELWFNDKGKSDIDPDEYKIDRVRNYYEQYLIHPKVNAIFTSIDYADLFQNIINKIRNLKYEKALLFIDPYGYKDINLDNLKQFLKNGQTEVLLFLPMTHMYRFVNKTLRKERFSGDEPLLHYINLLKLKNRNEFKSILDFIDEFKQSLTEFLNDQTIYVDTFTIERNSSNVYCLFFFTPNIYGFEKMLETKWKLDDVKGKGFRFNQNQSFLFPEIQFYSNDLKKFIRSNDNVTNANLYLFGLKKGFLPKHTNQILKEWQKDDIGFKIFDREGKQPRKGAFYINYQNFKTNSEKKLFFKYDDSIKN